MSHGLCTLSHVSYATQPRYCRNYALKIYDTRRNRRNAPSVARFSSPLRPCRSVSVFHGIISTVSKQLRYSHAGKLCVPVGQPGLTSLHKTRKNHHMYFKGIAKKSYHFVQNHIFNRKIHIKIIENTVLCP